MQNQPHEPKKLDFPSSLPKGVRDLQRMVRMAMWVGENISQRGVEIEESVRVRNLRRHRKRVKKRNEGEWRIQRRIGTQWFGFRLLV